MSFSAQAIKSFLKKGEIRKLFIEGLGWDGGKSTKDCKVDDVTYGLKEVAVKAGFKVWLCEMPGQKLPTREETKAVHRQLVKESYEHIIIFASKDFKSQAWLWVRREANKPISYKHHLFSVDQDGESLSQKLRELYIAFEEEEAGLDIVDVTKRAKKAFDVEKVTKKFYQEFDKHRKVFLGFIDGIPVESDREWYASVMLNRLMFAYFIQKKGFLDSNPDYLKSKLKECQAKKGEDKFYSFYRIFLLRLFHEGLGMKKLNRPKGLEALLGNIPYLNGGMFDVHELEHPDKYGKTIEIKDEAFERIFAYFDQYQWHLDERPLKNDKEINPDVLGYIFEKYINQKQMGAYYTKEDITEYISKNTIIPFLFSAVRLKCPSSFENPNGNTIWDLLCANPDGYIYEAVRHGCDLPLPEEISAGLDITRPALIERRQAWNKPAPEDYALPTEIWREVVARRERCEDARRKLAAGKIREVKDLIALNLDLRQFAQDVIQSCENPDLLLALWQEITTITVLDPTGGSGAFIFAALNILEPLYDACLDRMEGFLAEWDEKGKKDHPNHHKNFTEVLTRVDSHPNRRYFILKSIIVNNLYAVDIMEEAVEICKLRLFLKLAAQVEPDARRENLGVEPLPDIDFNIRAGNSLVGYATYDEVERAITSGLDFDNAMGKIAAKAADLQEAFDKFRQLQTEGDGSAPGAHKLELQTRLKALEDELNHHLAADCGVKVSDKAAYSQWVKSHQPFHWFIQFYGILKSGGFDVIIGNPPYVEIKSIDYEVRGFRTAPCGDLYALCMERSCLLLNPSGLLGMIVPVSIVSTEGFAELRRCLLRPYTISWSLNFAERPAKLFTGVEKRLTIWITHPAVSEKADLYLSNYKRWNTEERDALFAKIQFVLHKSTCSLVGDSLPKICTLPELRILERVSAEKPLELFFGGSGSHLVRYTRKLRYFVQFFDFIPLIKDSKGKKLEPSELKELHLQTEEERDVSIAVLNSSLFFWFFCAFSDVRNVNKREINAFRCSLDKMSPQVISNLRKLNKSLMRDFSVNSRMLTGDYGAHGVLQIQSFQPRLSKPILDQIDTVLASHYGFSAEELDFILNYDIKYRLGRNSEADDVD